MRVNAAFGRMRPGRATKRVRSSRASMLTALRASRPSTHNIKNTRMSAIWVRNRSNTELKHSAREGAKSSETRKMTCTGGALAQHRVGPAQNDILHAEWSSIRGTNINININTWVNGDKTSVYLVSYHLEQGAQRATACYNSTGVRCAFLCLQQNTPTDPRTKATGERSHSSCCKRHVVSTAGKR